MALLVMQQFGIGVLLPLAVALAVRSSHRRGPQRGQPAEPAQQREQRAQQAARRRVGWRAVLAATAAGRRAWRRADAALTSALTFRWEEWEVSGPQLLLCLWMLLGNAWLLCKAASMRH